MFKHLNLKAFGLIMTLALALVLSACSQDDSSAQTEGTSIGEKEIDIPYIATDNSAARSLVMAEVLKKAGYDVTTTPVTASGPMYASVSEDENAFHASGIFPSTDKAYYNQFKDDLTLYDQHHLIENVQVGLAVPKYVSDIDSIADLKEDNDFGKAVNHEIEGTDKRNGVMKETKNTIGEDDLKDYKLNSSSDQDQFKAIQQAHQQQKPILFTAMKPHWLHEETDYKMLKDPDKIYGDTNQHIDLVFNQNFKDRHPAAYTITTRMADDWSQSDEKDLAKKIFVDRKNPEQVAKDYVDDHDHKVDEWLKDIES
ncbi:glycine betaine/proline transport system substrate-binding protein [Staphylococcus auricularis]|uniref:ABC transporter substrate-binding protein n=1 Tax=Staphylococcus auricularis TaxID=29379 RepID=A0AAP8TSL6_9STAP|nr:glycine betaine ABC transporter substrate-binding protein [Staphylococcus auricularis]MBM0868408.1 ABC transporter substrate-binding protein [Staphylococcus auricularis]MCG7342175.1 ABC transporter substrate-binding protein [Staphylococcus auricularis]MDC6327076.1 glycine betaine ABC transporter substrate-binding protein [Staphylococcus auricularis]MDN4533284.1 glycine betaine ABC transporter substrate-binding protein [Staphylococcus auricularis]PNZ66308.1 ABC transporter substrate-binding 